VRTSSLAIPSKTRNLHFTVLKITEDRIITMETMSTMPVKKPVITQPFTNAEIQTYTYIISGIAHLV
jgi:hypothetical protein